MDIALILFTIAGLSLFEIVNSIDNAIINAEVLSTMSERAKRWFLRWGILIAVFGVRGLLPWIIIWIMTPDIGFIGSLTATFGSSSAAHEALEKSAPYLLTAGGTFLVFLFFHWLFVEDKFYGFFGERFFHENAPWFFAIVSMVLCVLVWVGLQVNPFIAFAAVVGSSAFFITHGFKEHAQKMEQSLTRKSMSDTSKLLYLEVIDTTFSIDGVLGAFAFTLAVPLILIGNGIGAVVVRQLTIKGISKIKKYMYLKNGAMYSIFFLGASMLLDGYGFHVPQWIPPVVTLACVGYFFYKSHRANNGSEKAAA